MVRSAFIRPPGPIVSPMHWSTPYLSGMSLSSRHRLGARHFDAVDEVIGPGTNTLRRSAVAVTVQLSFLPISPTIFSNQLIGQLQALTSISTKASSPPARPAVLRTTSR